MQKYLRDHLSKITSYDELEEELVAELHRRDADGEKGSDTKGFNQLGEESAQKPDDKTADDKVMEEEWVEKTVWTDDWGWIRALTPSAKRARTDDETPPDFRAPPQKAKGKVDRVVLPEVAGSAEAQTTIRETARKQVKEKVGTHRCRLHGRRGAPGNGRDQPRRSGERGCYEKKVAENE